jgi:diguanylate cyclase (GGDEF)-like protein
VREHIHWRASNCLDERQDRAPLGVVLGLGVLAWIPWGASVVAQVQVTANADLDRAEQLSLTDSSAALRLLDKLQPAAQDREGRVRWLMIQGMAYADASSSSSTSAVVQRLRDLGRDQPAALAASHIVRAWILRQNDQLDRAEAELQSVTSDAGLPAFERFRLYWVRGSVLLYAGRPDTALSTFEQALDLAQAMHSAPRLIEANIKISVVFTLTASLDRAASQLLPARNLAEQSDDQAALALVSYQAGAIADRRGEQDEKRRDLVEAMAHATRVGSDQLMWKTSLGLSDYYLKAGDYATSLVYSKQAAVLAGKLQRKSYEQVSRFNMGMAQIGLGQVKAGKQLAEGVIQEALAGGNPVSADQLLREYLPALEHAGELRDALKVFHRDEQLRDQLMTAARQKALLELSAKFDSERRAQQIELLQRDNAIKSRDLQAQRLKQQIITMGAALIALTCVALAWGIGRIRKINARLLQTRGRDPLTGLNNRRYFNEQILALQDGRPYVGCLLLIDVDDFKRINDLLGHAAGDAVLANVGKRLTAICHDDVLVRWGDAEFLAVLGPMSQAELNHTAQRVLHAIRSEPVPWDTESISCTVSMGGASFPVTGAGVDIPLCRAMILVDNALARAKRRGRNRACLITRFNAISEQDVISISINFEATAQGHRVQTVEIESDGAIQRSPAEELRRSHWDSAH